MSQSAWNYHRHTAYERHRMSGHSLDWGSQPTFFKRYPDTEPLPLPEVTALPDRKASALYGGSVQEDSDREMTLDVLAGVLILCHALTAKTTHGGVDFYYRSVASAGALYPFEVYVAVTNIQGLDDGVYHHSVANQALTQLRRGDASDFVVRSVPVGDRPTPVVSFFLTAIFYRSSWKYRERAYRYNLLDTGHLAENLAQALRISRVPFRVYYDFDDAIVNELLCLDTNREVCLALALGWARPSAEGRPKTPSVVLGDPRSASRVAVKEIDYPAIREAHAASSRLIRTDELPGDMLRNLGLEMGKRIPVPSPERSPEVTGYADALFARRSLRNFVAKEMPFDCFAALVNMVCCDADSDDRSLDQTVAVGLLVGNVEGMEPGFYMVDRKEFALLHVAHGFMMNGMASACLNQGWLSNCALHFLFLANLDVMERIWGARAYRYAMFSAGRLGQRIYVGTTAMQMGCCGIGAFYDGEAAKLLRIPDECSLLYLVAAGPVKKWPAGGLH